MKKEFIASSLLFLLPTLVSAAPQSSDTGFNWGEIIGSMIVVAIISIAFWVEAKKKEGNTKDSKLLKEIKLPKIPKNIKILFWIIIVFFFIKAFIS